MGNYIGNKINNVKSNNNLPYIPTLTNLTLSKPDLGDISFLKALPTDAAPKGSRPLLNSNSFLKFTNIPCAVSGLRKL